MDRIATLEAQVAEHKKDRGLPKSEPPDEEVQPAGRLLSAPDDAHPSDRYWNKENSVRREETHPSDEAKSARRSTFNEQNVAVPQSGFRILLPSPMPKDWQRLEIGGSAY